MNGWWCEQVTGDSGVGATLGDFNGRTAGVSPVVSFGRKFGDLDFIAEVNWLPELETRNRLQGASFWLKAIFKFLAALGGSIRLD